MSIEKAKAADAAVALVGATRGFDEQAHAAGVYHVECRDADGNLKWEEHTHNTVVNVGLQDMNTKYFVGSAYTAAWYLGLITGPTGSVNILPTDTVSSHTGWTEATGYTQTNRPTCVFGATPTNANPSVATNSASTATFSINASAIISGAFLVSNNTKGNTSLGILYSAAKFQTPGDRTVINGDTITVTYTLNLAG
jgi:hypothetical protein